MKTKILILITLFFASCSTEQEDCNCTEIRTITTIQNDIANVQVLPEQESEYNCNFPSYEFVDFHDYVNGIETIESVKLNCE